MPTGPRGEKRPADVIGNAVKVMRIAQPAKKRNRLAQLRSGRRGDRPARQSLTESGPSANLRVVRQ